MRTARVLILALLSAAMLVAACGKKGPPIRPGDEPPEEKSILD
jgi:predicted small lipoprotein YifL